MKEGISFKSVLRLYFVVVSSIFLALVVSLQMPGVGSDYNTYFDIYYIPLSEVKQWYIEPFSKFLFSIFRTLDIDFKFFLFCYALLSVSLKFCFFLKGKSIVYIAVPLYALSFFLDLEYMALRIGLALGFFIWAFWFHTEGKKYYSYIFLILSISTHITIIVLCFLIFLISVGKGKWFLKFNLLFSILVYMFIDIRALVVSLASNINLDRYVNYIARDNYQINVFNSVFLFNLILVSSFYFFFKAGYKNKFTYNLYYLAIFSLSIKMVLSPFGVMASRLFDLLSFMAFLLMLNMWLLVKNDKQKIIYIFILMIYFVMYIHLKVVKYPNHEAAMSLSWMF